MSANDRAVYSSVQLCPPTLYHVPMNEFFHGWRRKTGVVTLGLACILIAGWIRSLVISDCLGLPIGRTSEIRSDNQLLVGTWSDGPVDFNWARTAWTTEASSSNSRSNDPLVDWHVKWIGIGVGHTRATEMGTRIHRNHLFVGYWLLTIPLSALSAYLILWRLWKRESLPAPCPN
jgi:hypothetical protein